MSLTEQQEARYARQVLLPEIGEAGQARLLAGSVLVAGVGGLGSPACLYLAAAGVGRLGIIDGDVVELSNLQRQVAHATCDIGTAKVESAAAKLRAINPDVSVRTYRERLVAANAPEILRGYDFIVDATDNFASKFLIADACHLAGKPNVHAGVLRFGGQVMTVLPGRTACYRCVFNAPPPETDGPTAGPLGTVPGVLGALQAAEAIKFILGRGDLLTDKLLVYDALRSDFRKVTLKRNPGCPLCGDHPAITDLKDMKAPRA